MAKYTNTYFKTFVKEEDLKQQILLENPVHWKQTIEIFARTSKKVKKAFQNTSLEAPR